MGCSPWVHKESDVTEYTHTHTHTHTQYFESGSEEDVVFLWLNFPSKCG